MAPPREGASVETLREAARQHVDSTSLRQAARDIGMSPTGLRGFLDGADPYGKTTRKLTQWFVKERQVRSDELTAEAAGAALSLLVQHFAPRYREEISDDLLDVVDRRGREVRTPRPGWLVEMRKQRRSRKNR
ncbi:MAG TPA: hypothetical protein VFX98_14040 [Longimicrobiaceae bacterium]|nr:hypothetical protein [Longimicrobiaceae bacterium]